MRNYFHNVWAWLAGFGKLKSLDYRDGWDAWQFAPVYLLNVGSHVVFSGGAVQTWSRAFYEWRVSGSVAAKFVDRLLQRILGDNHGENSHPAYWGTTPCIPSVRAFVLVWWTLVLSITTASAQVVYQPTPLYWQAYGLVQTCKASGACPSWVDLEDDFRRVVVGQNTFLCMTDHSDPKRRAVIGAPTTAAEELLKASPGILLDLVNPVLRKPVPNEALLACFPDWEVPAESLGEPIYSAVPLTPQGTIDWARMNSPAAGFSVGTTTKGETCGNAIATQVPTTGSTDPRVGWYWLRGGGTRCRK
jgi:hypothetical protein